jgi:hypothetical protein
VYGSARIGIAAAFAAYIPLVASRNGRRSATPTERAAPRCRTGAGPRTCSDTEAAARRSRSGTDRHVAHAGGDPVEQELQLGDRVLAVGVHASAELVAV